MTDLRAIQSLIRDKKMSGSTGGSSSNNDNTVYQPLSDEDIAKMF